MYYEMRDSPLLLACNRDGCPALFKYRRRYVERVTHAIPLRRRTTRERTYWRIFTTRGLALDIYQEVACGAWHLERVYC